MKNAHQELVIQGSAGKRILRGNIPVYGAKNAALKALAATLLFDDTVRLSHVPYIEDIARIEEIMCAIGVSIHARGRSREVNTREVHTTTLPTQLAQRIRASVVLTGPLLARFGKVVMPFPGGCEIGLRPIDIFLEGFQKMGARVKEGKDTCTIQARTLKGTDIFLRRPSVTATETLMMAATRAHGVTHIQNAAMEPEIIHLANFLNVAGAHITGAGTPTVTIKGSTKALHARGRAYKTPPDRIEAGSFLIFAALAGTDVTITQCDPTHLQALIHALHTAGVGVETTKNTMRVRARNVQTPLHALDIVTHEYPGFPTDLQAPMTVLLTQAKGESQVFETIFENRLRYTEDLMRMNANITQMDPHRILVRGPRALRCKDMESPDLRAGLAFVIAASIARGTSTIANVYNIDRGYENIEVRLAALGAKIERRNI